MNSTTLDSIRQATTNAAMASFYGRTHLRNQEAYKIFASRKRRLVKLDDGRSVETWWDSHSRSFVTSVCRTRRFCAVRHAMNRSTAL